MNTAHFVTDLFDQLHLDEVRICHWKSNHHLDEAIAGRTDLDVLVHPEDRTGLEGVFEKLGFTRVLNPWESRYPGLEDWLGVDPGSGGLVHMHVHYRLVVGPKYVKCYHLPLEEWVMADLGRVGSVPVPQPEVELLLLILRMHLKLSRRELRRKMSSPGREAFPEAIALEFDWLAGRVPEDALRRAIEETGLALDPQQVADFVERFPKGEVTSTQIASLRGQVFRAVEPHRWEPRPQALRRELVARLVKDKLIRRSLPSRKKRLLDGGRVVALIGADGAGKTTLAEELRRHLSWKLCVETAYLGLPKRAATLRVLRWVRRRFKDLRLRRFASVLSALSWIWIARHRLRTVRRIHKLAERGALVILDRYPQPEFASMPEPMDGPRVAGESDGRLASLASWERSIYDRIQPATDCFVLTASLECLRSRKSDLSIEKHRIKADAVNALALEPGRIAIDASRPLEDVRREITCELWQRISKRSVERCFELQAQRAESETDHSDERSPVPVESSGGETPR